MYRQKRMSVDEGEMTADGTQCRPFPREDFGTSRSKDSLLKPTKS
jgi:hypothetical protein